MRRTKTVTTKRQLPKSSTSLKTVKIYSGNSGIDPKTSVEKLGVRTQTKNLQEEMAAVDKLHPKLRKVINYSVIEWNATTVLLALKEYMKHYPDVTASEAATAICALVEHKNKEVQERMDKLFQEALEGK